MTKIDSMYLENLSEFVFDEKKVVTYKFLSVTLGVHVNIAKQMLYHFYKTEKAKGKKVYATYYLSGMAPQKLNLNAVEGSISSQGSMESDSQNSFESFLVVLCKDQDLEELKKKFTRIFSVHVYAISGFPLDNYDVLKKAVEEPLRDENGKTPVDFGSITCKAAFEVRENPRLAPLLKNVEEVKANMAKVTKDRQDKEKIEQVKKETKPADMFKSTSNSSKPGVSPTKSSVSSASATSKKGTESDVNRLKNMFAAVTAKQPKEKVVPKEKEPPVKEAPELKKKETATRTAKTHINSSSSNKPHEKNTKHTSQVGKNSKSIKAKGKSAENQSRKRKRIKDVFSSSSESEDQASEEDYGLPESPIPRKRNLIESDSDEDFKETPSKKPAVEKPDVKPEVITGKKRVLKTVSKSHVDDDGYLVTVKEVLMVSEAENSDGDGESCNNGKAVIEKTDKKEQKVKDDNPVVPNSKSGTKEKKVSSTSSAPKTKQASLMSFFQKK